VKPKSSVKALRQGREADHHPIAKYKIARPQSVTNQPTETQKSAPAGFVHPAPQKGPVREAPGPSVRKSTGNQERRLRVTAAGRRCLPLRHRAEFHLYTLQRAWGAAKPVWRSLQFSYLWAEQNLFCTLDENCCPSSGNGTLSKILG
jgi:hypothetical protein